MVKKIQNTIQKVILLCHYHDLPLHINC
uniref:Uncharacterized protein n=1 Tax=Anguilla anguilla TaxID=7936 RepID=A0A0E9RRL7_ANGAN